MCYLCARMCACDWAPTHPRRRMRAPFRRREPRVASARRRSGWRRRSTRTSARGTPPRSPTCPRYESCLSGPGGAPPQAGRARSGRRCGAGRCARRDHRWLGAQAFYSASAFNANIGAWNTASITSLSSVCAAFPARAARHRRRAALGRVVDAARAVVRGGTTGARARVCAETCGHAHARASTCVGIAARTKDGIYVCMYTCIYIYVSISICMHYTYICR
jgi:hypothetical protein